MQTAYPTPHLLRRLSGLTAVLAACAMVSIGLIARGAPVGPQAFDQSHGAWTELLEQYVSDGFVDYAGLKATGDPGLTAYLSALETVTAADFANWSQEEQLAYWINVYNAYTLRLMIDHYPIKSIRSIGLLPGAAWRKKIVPLKALRGKTISLNDVEHKILRKEYDEPRIHFAIVCASISCPALRGEAYTGAALESQLDEATRGFLLDETKNRYEGGELRLSSIFDWFSEDFERGGQTVQGFVGPYLDPAISAETPVSHLDYDWSLNGR